MAVEVSQGVCDLCGAASDASLQECNWLTCTYQHCEGGLYHQECLEKYLKSNKLEKNRKTGFKCPRGCGKGTRFDQACPGRIDKSHPIHPRNEDKKKTKLAAVVVEPQRPAKPAVPVVQNGKTAKAKEESKVDAPKDFKSATPAKAVPAAKLAPASSAVASATVAGPKAVRKEAAALPPRPEVVTKQKLVELAAQARRELGLPASNTSLASHGSKGDLQVLASSAAGPSKPVSATAALAWGKPSAPATDSLSINLQPTMMSQLPQFQQLLQQAASVKKQAPKSTASVTANVAPQAAPKPVPAIPQPVTPPMPVWPALGTVQTSATTLFTSSSVPSTQTSSREATPRPGSPPSAWGSTSTAPSSSQPQHQPSQQPQNIATGSSLVSVASAPTPRSHACAGASAPSSSGTTALVGPSTSAGSAPAAPGSSTAPAVAAAATAAASALGSGSAQGSAPAAGCSGTACSSGRLTVAEPQPGSAGAPSSAASAAAASAGPSSRTGSQLVGAEFVDEQKLTKAQKKNLKRTEKKKSPLGTSTDQQQGAGEGSAPEASEASSRVSIDGGDGGSRHTSGDAAGSSGRQPDSGGAPSASGRTVMGGGSTSGKHQRQASHGSDDPEQAHIAEAEEATVMEELCVNCIVAHKVLSLITQLQRLGALEYVAAAAVQRHGSNLLAALEWLLVAGADAASAPADVVLVAAAESASAEESEVDISEELQQLHDLQAAMGVPPELLQQCVLDCNGDVQTAANTAMERMLSAPALAAAAPVPVAATAAAAGSSRIGDARVSSGSGSMHTGGHGNGIALRGAASFYSVSSLDGAVSVPDGEVAQPPQQQQQARSSHFGVRLQDEPSGCAGSGFGMGNAITKDFLRGGVVVSASGWPNGYLRESPPPLGFPSGAAARASGASTGRSTSRLLHWLRDEPGRAMALEEQVLEALGGSGSSTATRATFVSDPILESPFLASHGSGATRARGTSGDSVGSPSLAYWLGGNGYHRSITAGSMGQMVPGGSPPAAGGITGAHDPYSGGGATSPGNFSFISTLSKQPSVSSRGGMLEPLGGYGSRWVGLSASEAARQEASSRLLFAGATGLVEPDQPVPHADGGDNDLNAIMALINVR